MTTIELSRHLRPRLGDRAFLDLASLVKDSRAHFPSQRTARATVLQALLRRGAQQGWAPTRLLSELRALGLSYRRGYVVDRLNALGLRRKNPRRVAAARRSA